jgi:hypothetical protein
MMKKVPLLVALMALSFLTRTASAEENKPIEIRVKITSRVPRPMAAIDVARIVPKVGAVDQQERFVARIEQVIAKEPF